MATTADLVARTYEVLFGVARVERPAEDTLSGAILIGAVSLTPTTTAMWKRDDYAEFADGEVVIFAADSAGATAVRRAQRGSTAAAQADGAVMRKNPWPLRVDIERKIDEVLLLDLWEHVWSWHNGTITYVAGDHLYDLPQYVEKVASVEQANVDSDGQFRPVDTSRWDVERQVASAIAANGNLLRLRDPFDGSSTIHYRGMRRPHPDDIANLDDELVPLVAWAAAAKCFAADGGATKDRARTQRSDATQQAQKYQMLMGEFLRMRSDYSRQLVGEVPRDMRFRRRFRMPY